jgi:Family of unknown function (DUF6152)
MKTYMKFKVLLSLAVLAGLVLSAVPTFAHHGRTGYDNNKTLTLKGTVTHFEWANPHVQILFDAPDEKGVMKHWDVEAANPFSEVRIGWTKNEFKPGDQITISFHPAANGNGVGLFIKATLPDGRVAGGGGGANPNSTE